MSVESIAIALHHSRARGTTKLVLLGIANHDGDGGAWPTIATLATYAGGVDERTVRRSIAELVDLGEVVVHVNGGGDRNTRGDQRPNLYEVVLCCPDGSDRTKNHRAHGRTPVSSRAGNGGTPVSERGDVGIRNGGTPTSAEPSYEPSINQEGATPEVTSPARDTSSPSPKDDLGGNPSSVPVPLARPERCVAHQLDVAPPPCGACKVARETAEATARARARQEVERERHERQAAARLQALDAPTAASAATTAATPRGSRARTTPTSPNEHAAARRPHARRSRSRSTRERAARGTRRRSPSVVVVPRAHGQVRGRPPRRVRAARRAPVADQRRHGRWWWRGDARQVPAPIRLEVVDAMTLVEATVDEFTPLVRGTLRMGLRGRPEQRVEPRIVRTVRGLRFLGDSLRPTYDTDPVLGDRLTDALWHARGDVGQHTGTGARPFRLATPCAACGATAVWVRPDALSTRCASCGAAAGATAALVAFSASSPVRK